MNKVRRFNTKILGDGYRGVIDQDGYQVVVCANYGWSGSWVIVDVDRAPAVYAETDYLLDASHLAYVPDGDRPLPDENELPRITLKMYCHSFGSAMTYMKKAQKKWNQKKLPRIGDRKECQ